MAIDALSEYQAHLPSGAAWPRAVETVSHDFARGLTHEFERINARVEQLLLEMDPRTTTELIDDWERVAGLPDPCAAVAPTAIEDRRAALTARIIARGGWSGGPSVPFLKQVIAALGYDAAHTVIRRFHRGAFTCQSPCNAALNTREAGWSYVWEIIVQHGSLDQQLMCMMSERYALAHIGLTFAFPLFFFSDGTFSRAGSGVFTDPTTGMQTALGPDELGTAYVGI